MRNEVAPQFEPILDIVGSRLLGKEDVIIKTMTAFFAGGHLLLEDIPGVGKTTLAKSFAKVLGLEFARIQFTSDLLPSDIIGINYFDTKLSKFIFKKGAIFTQFLLADEINRSMPKTQSALLEAMEEGAVTIDGITYPLPKPFFVMATQNPYEERGTFALPHSQLDRFICSFGIGYPDKESEKRAILGLDDNFEDIEPIMSEEEILSIQKSVKEVKISEAMLEYIQEIVSFSRESKLFRYGLSTRGAIALAQMTRSWAKIHGRDYTIPDDLKAVVAEVCIHRLKFVEGKTTIDRIREEILSAVSFRG